ncbi:hypothetical protein B0H11DRAFT_2281250 [Mycena galericulata]|nr:hypothetical protein B0H11DRAFT_2281250 [Mycena galericulata]
MGEEEKRVETRSCDQSASICRQRARTTHVHLLPRVRTHLAQPTPLLRRLWCRTPGLVLLSGLGPLLRVRGAKPRAAVAIATSSGCRRRAGAPRGHGSHAWAASSSCKPPTRLQVGRDGSTGYVSDLVEDTIS